MTNDVTLTDERAAEIAEEVNAEERAGTFGGGFLAYGLDGSGGHPYTAGTYRPDGCVVVPIGGDASWTAEDVQDHWQSHAES